MPDAYTQFGLRCLSAPNRYRRMLAASLSIEATPGVTRYATVKGAIIERMIAEYSDTAASWPGYRPKLA